MTPLSNDGLHAWHIEPRRLFEQAPDAILVFDDQLEYRDANTAAMSLLQRRKEEIVGAHLGDFSEVHDGARFARRVLEAKAEAVVEDNLTILLPDGSSRYVEVNTRPNILPCLHVSFMRDVTEKRHLQRDLEHRSRLEALGKLASGVAHDFNNMLTAILSYADLQLQWAPKDEKVRRYALGIQAAAERASETTRQLLAFCRKQSTTVSELDVNEKVRETAELVSRLVGENILISMELAPEVPPVLGDPGQLSQVLVNLAVNARDAMPLGGQLKFVTSTRDVGVRTGELEPGKYVSILVRDTGAGISPEVLPHIFDPFFTTKSAGKGTGLGLSTVYGIVQQYKGQIRVTSADGHGTTFEVLLPACIADAAPKQSGREHPLGPAEFHGLGGKLCEF